MTRKNKKIIKLNPQIGEIDGCNTVIVILQSGETFNQGVEQLTPYAMLYVRTDDRSQELQGYNRFPTLF